MAENSPLLKKKNQSVKNDKASGGLRLHTRFLIMFFIIYSLSLTVAPLISFGLIP